MAKTIKLPLISHILNIETASDTVTHFRGCNNDAIQTFISVHAIKVVISTYMVVVVCNSEVAKCASILAAK